MMRCGVILALLYAVCLVGCDPSRRIEMKNYTNDTAEVVWKAKTDSIGFNPFNISNSKELRFVIPPHRNSAVRLSFGIGKWSPAEVEKIIHRLEYFQLTLPSQKLRIDSLAELRDYLLARRKSGSSIIEIAIR